MSTEPESAPTEEQTPISIAEREPSQQETAMLIADRLGEHDHAVRAEIARIVRALGRTQARNLLEQALQIEAQGGMMLPNGSRRRSLGGVFFHLAYTTGRAKRDGQPLRRPYYAPQKPSASGATSTQPKGTTNTAQAFPWEDRLGIIEAIGTAKGTVTVKITLIGKPGTYVEKGTCVVAVVQSDKTPTLPKGLPEPAAVKTTYVVYVALKQWKNIAGTLEDTDDALIIEGFPQLDAKTGAISVFATSVTSKKLQAAKRQNVPQKTS